MLWITDLIDGIHQVYEWNTATPTLILMEFIWVGRLHFLGTGWIGLKGRLDYKVPGFIDEMLRRYAVSPWRKNAAWAPQDDVSEFQVRHSGSCVRCYTELPRATNEKPNAAAGQLWDPFNLTADHEVRREWCQRCAASKTIPIPWRSSKH